MSRDTGSPGEEFKVAIAGPLVTLAIVGICIGGSVALGGGHDFCRAPRSTAPPRASPPACCS